MSRSYLNVCGRYRACLQTTTTTDAQVENMLFFVAKKKNINNLFLFFVKSVKKTEVEILLRLPKLVNLYDFVKFDFGIFLAPVFEHMLVLPRLKRVMSSVICLRRYFVTNDPKARETFIAVRRVAVNEWQWSSPKVAQASLLRLLDNICQISSKLTVTSSQRSVRLKLL